MFVRSLALGALASLSLAWGAQASSWDGYYIGVMGIYGAAETDTTRTITGTSYFADTSITAIQNASAMSLSEEAFGGGGQFGLNVPIGEKFILGFEVDAAGFGNEMSGSSTVAYPCCLADQFHDDQHGRAILGGFWPAAVRLCHRSPDGLRDGRLCRRRREIHADVFRHVCARSRCRRSKLRNFSAATASAPAWS